MFYKPQQEPLNRLIVCYWFISAPAIPEKTKMLPDGHSDIMLNFGAPYYIYSPDGSAAETAGHALLGQRTRHLLLDQPGAVNMIGIRLKPCSEYVFSGIHAKLLLNKHVSLNTIIPDEISGIKRLEENPALPEREKVPLVDALLLNMLQQHGTKADATTGRAVDYILKHKGNVRVEEVLEQLQLTYKQAERLFQKHIGLSPKLFIRVHRFYNAFVQVRALEKANWMDVLTGCGYYDQAHFIKDFRFFSGVLPAKLLTANNTLDKLFGFR